MVFSAISSLASPQQRRRLALSGLRQPRLQTTAPPSRENWMPLEHQRPPMGSWDVWLILAGRGSGKTRAGAEYVLQHLDLVGSAARVGIGAPTSADVRDVCAEGSSGI